MNSMVHVLKPGQCSFDEDQTRFIMIVDCTPYENPFTLLPWCSCTHSWRRCSPRITQTVTNPYLQTYKVNRDFSMKVPDSKVHGANMGPIWGRQDPGGPHVGPMNLAIWGGMVPFLWASVQRCITWRCLYNASNWWPSPRETQTESKQERDCCAQ